VKDKHREKVKKAVAKVESFLQQVSYQAPETLKDIWSEILVMVEMLRAWLRGEYQAPWKTISAIVIALTYLANPFDVIPDFILGLGFVDDLAVLKKALDVIRSDIERYQVSLTKDDTKRSTSPPQ
jgi:uncharacterized membrane protein YkvA (DUF1232 family)